MFFRRCYPPCRRHPGHLHCCRKHVARHVFSSCRIREIPQHTCMLGGALCRWPRSSIRPQRPRRQAVLIPGNGLKACCLGRIGSTWTANGVQTSRRLKQGAGGRTRLYAGRPEGAVSRGRGHLVDLPWAAGHGSRHADLARVAVGTPEAGRVASACMTWSEFASRQRQARGQFWISRLALNLAR